MYVHNTLLTVVLSFPVLIYAFFVFFVVYYFILCSFLFFVVAFIVLYDAKILLFLLSSRFGVIV